MARDIGGACCGIWCIEVEKWAELVLEYCREPRSRSDIQHCVGMKDLEHFRLKVLQPLLEKGLLLMTIPDKPKSSKQRYITKTNT
ncbi:MAG: Fic family protein [Desulfuromonadaceae bacterium]